MRSDAGRAGVGGAGRLDGRQAGPVPVGRSAAAAVVGAAVLVLALVGAAAHAADPVPAKGGTLGKAPGQSAAPPSTGPLLTREELRQCLRQEDELKIGNARLVEVQSGLESEGSALAEAENALKAEREGVDATQAEAVTAFNARLAALRERAEAYRSRALAFNAEVTGHQARHKVWVDGCGGRSYDEIDYYAIQRGK